MIPCDKNLPRPRIRSSPFPYTSFIYNVQPSPIFLSACTITRFLWFERGVGGQASQYRPLSPVICEKCSKRYPRNKFPRNFPSYSSGKSLRSFDLSFLPLPSVSLPLLDSQPRATENARAWEKEDSPKR